MTVFLTLVFFLLLFFYLPIRVGVTGTYGEDGLQLKIWVAILAGATGVGILFQEGRRRLVPILGIWLPWGILLKSKEAQTDDGVELDAENEGDDEAGRDDVSLDKNVGDSADKSPKDDADQSWGERVSVFLSKVVRIYGYIKNLLPSAGRFLKRLSRVIVFRRLRCTGVFGTSNPSITGQVYGYLQAISRVLGRRVVIQVSPDFEQARVAGEVELEISIYLNRLIWAVTCVALKAGKVLLIDFGGRWLQTHVWVRFGKAQ